MRLAILALALLVSVSAVAEEAGEDAEFLAERAFIVDNLRAKAECLAKSRNWEEMDACHQEEDLRGKKHEIEKLEMQKKKLDEEAARLKKEMEEAGKK